MKLESQVASLELSKKLKSLVVKQESAFYWCEPWPNNTDQGIALKTEFNSTERDVRFRYSAFTVAELGEMLPMVIRIYPAKNSRMVFVTGKTLGNEWRVEYRNEKFSHPIVTVATTEADARASMLIYLIEKGIVKP